MHGFKSFADPVVVDFHEGITCIVGPNGSGKSNISDAIRWVLGEQSPKALRGGKMEEVIFAGTASRKSRGMAEVVLVIDNSSKILDIDYNEVAITRRMYRSGESEYLINNNICRLRDIRELIMDTGIGVDGYSLIGQGKIADIVSTKPESRREIFEEAAGVVMYKNKRSEAEKKLSSTQTNLERISDIIHEIEIRIDPLRDESIKAKELIELQKKYEDLEINLILHNIDKIEQSNKTLKEDMAYLEDGIDDITSSHHDILSKTSNISDRRDIIDDLSVKLRDQIMTLVHDINDMNSRNDVCQERLIGIENEKKVLQGDISNLHKKLEEEKDSVESIHQEVDELSKELKNASENLNKCIMLQNQAAIDKTELAANLDESKGKIFELHNEKMNCNSEVKGVETLKESLLGRVKELDSLRESNEKVGAETIRSFDETKENLKKFEEKSQKLKTELNSFSGKIKQIETNRRSKMAEREKHTIESMRLSSRRKTMQEMESNYEGYNYGVRTLMKSEPQGIRGVVAELMKVPKGFEQAIETAMGASLQNIICNSDVDAKRSISFLKEKRAGRLTFLPISSIRHSSEIRAGSIEKQQGFIDYAVNLIEFDEEYRDIYGYLLHKLVVVKDMDSAIKLSKLVKGFRFVTLEGEIINASGAITGGIYKNKSVNILERKAEIQALSDKQANLDAAIKELSKGIDEDSSNIDSLSSKMAGKESELLSVESDVINFKSNLEAMKMRLKNESEAMARIDAEIEQINLQLKNTDDMTVKQLQRIDEIDVEFIRLESDVDMMTKSLDEASQNLLEQSEAVTDARIILNQVESKSEAKNQIFNRINNVILGYESEIKNKEDRLVELSSEIEKLNDESSDVSIIADKIKEKEESEQTLKSLSEERESIIAQQKELEALQSNAADKINAMVDKKYQIEIKLSKTETQIENLKEKLWEEFEISYAEAEDRRTSDFKQSQAVKETRAMRNRMKEIGNVSVSSIDEYEQVSERHGFLVEQREDILKAKDELESIIREMDQTIKRRFKSNFDEVVANFEVIFKELFGGGYAELRLEDASDPLKSGIEIIAEPPGKKLQNINLMSGGEKTMTAIALMFAVLKTKPTPFCILDEVEAALDDSNIERFARYLRKFNEIQFALVTHQKATMEHADVLYGVTMPEEGISKLLSLRLGDDFQL